MILSQKYGETPPEDNNNLFNNSLLGNIPSREDNNTELEETIAQYEALLVQLTTGPKRIGTVKAGPYKGLYTVAVGSEEIIIPLEPEKNEEGNSIMEERTDEELAKILKTGDLAMCSQASIVCKMEEPLIPMGEVPEFNRIAWEEIGGIKSQVAKIRESVEMPITHSEYYEAYGLTPPKGILLYGPSGCGKTMIAKAIASNILPDEIHPDSFIYMKGGEMLSPYVGVTEQKIKSTFDRARKYYSKYGQRPVIFIDEAEAILPARGSRKSSDVETTIVPTFLSEMDGLEENNCFIILATNFKNSLDPAIIRAGRIDIHVEIDRPTLNDAKEIFAVHLSKTKLAEDINILVDTGANILFSELSSGKISGALIKNIVQNAGTLAIKRNVNNEDSMDKLGIRREDIILAIQEITHK